VDRETKGTLLVTLTALSSGAAIIVNRFFVLHIDPVIFTAVRALLIGLAFLVLSSSLEREKRRIPLYQLTVLGFIGGGLAFLLFFTGLRMTTGGRAAFIHKTLPVWASILAFLFLKERITKKQAVAIATALLGLVVMEHDNIPLDIKTGDLLTLSATVLWAIENTLAKYFMRAGETNWRVTFARMFFGSIFLFAVALLQRKLALLLALKPVEWFYLFISTLMLTFYVLTWYWGLRYINLSKASGILLLSPVISLILGVIFLGEEVFPMQLLGSALILAGCYVLGKTKSEVFTGGELP